jgi:hypothetical protein
MVSQFWEGILRPDLSPPTFRPVGSRAHLTNLDYKNNTFQIIMLNGIIVIIYTFPVNLVSWLVLAHQWSRPITGGGINRVVDGMDTHGYSRLG